MEEQQRTITVSGHGKVITPADLGHLTLGVREIKSDLDSAVSSSNQRITEVQDAILAAGVSREDIKLRRFTIAAEYDRVDGRQVFRGYRVSHDLSVTVRDIDRTGELLSIAVRAGADDVQGVSFSVEDPGSSIDLARERSFDNARHKAEELARLAGSKLGAVISMSETSFEPVPVERHELRTTAASFAKADHPPDVPISPDDAEFSVQIEVVWEIIV